MRFRSLCMAIVMILVSGCSEDTSQPTDPGDRIPPSTVTDLAVEAVTANSITVTWTAPGDDGGTGTADRYDLRYSPNPITTAHWDDALQAPDPPSPATPGNTESYSLTGLTPDTAYHLALRTSDSAGNWSGISNSIAATTAAPPDETPPGAISDLAAEEASSTAIRLTWTAPGNDGSEGTADRYEIRYATFEPADSTWSMAFQAPDPPDPEAAGTMQEHLLTGLEPSTFYFAAIRAADEADNWSPMSNIASATTGSPPDEMPPAAVSDLAVESPTLGSLTLTWTAPGDDGDLGTAYEYDIRHSTSPMDAASFPAAVRIDAAPLPAPAGTRQNMTVTGLQPGTTYYLGLRTADEAGNWSLLSNIATGSTTVAEDTTPPAAVLDLHAGSPTTGSLTLTWTSPGDDGNQGTASIYDLRIADVLITEAGWESAERILTTPPPSPPGSRERHTVTELLPGLTYYFALKTGDEVLNWSDISNVAQASTSALIDTIAPGEVTDLAVEQEGLDFLALTWTAPGNDGDTGTASVYDIRYSTAPILEENWEDAERAAVEAAPKPAGTPEGFTLSGLQPGTIHHVAMKTGDEAGNWSGLSNTIAGNTLPPPDTTPPAAVMDLVAVAQTPMSLTLSWTAPGDDGDTGTASVYDLRYLTYPITAANWVWAIQARDEPDPLPAGQTQLFEATDLLPQTTYYFAMKTADELGNWSPLSNTATGTTEPASGDIIPPSRITDLSAGSATMNSAVLTWTATGDDYREGTATTYDIRYSTTAFSEVTWDNALQVADIPAPLPSGSTQSHTVTGLSPGIIYYFGMKAADEVPNWSGLSNVTSVTTVSLPDTIPPSAVADLRIAEISADYVALRWTATGDDGHSGRATTYDMRYSTSPISQANWDAAVPVPGMASPNASGFPEQLTVRNLDHGTTHYFALNVADEVPNWSGLSNVPMATTLLPALTGHLQVEGGGPISSALVELKQCGGADTGLFTYTEPDGFFQFITVPPGDYFLQIIRAGCTDYRDPPDSECFTISGTGTLHRGHINMLCEYTAWVSVTLTWGENPRDLDLHCWTPGIEGREYHIYYADRGAISLAPYAELDHDDVTSYGPENITVYENFPGEYVFAVYHYSGSGTISTSGGRVRIVDPAGGTYEVEVPMGATGSHWWWWICRVDGTTGAVTLLNEVNQDPPAGLGIMPRPDPGLYKMRKQ